MVGRSLADAVEGLFGPLQRAVSCVTDAVLVGRAYRPAPQPHVLSFGQYTDVPLGRRSELSFRVKLLYQLVAPPAETRSWTVSTVGYEYRISFRDQREVVVYHWHPLGKSPITFPHLHVSGPTTPVDVSKAHLPTGYVPLTPVLRFAIADLGVEPLRPDWTAILDESERQLSN